MASDLIVEDKHLKFNEEIVRNGSDEIFNLYIIYAVLCFITFL